MVAALVATAMPIASQEGQKAALDGPPAMAFVGLHGGVFAKLKAYEKELGVRLDYVSDEEIAAGKAEFARYRIVFLQHVRAELKSRYRELLSSARKRQPGMRVLDISGGAARRLPGLAKRGLIEKDQGLSKYYGSSPENLRRFLIYVLVKYLGQERAVLPPEEVARFGIHHPDHKGLFGDAKTFLDWARAEGKPVQEADRVVVAVHYTHLALQQPRVVDALIRALEEKGVLAMAVVDSGPEYESQMRALAPEVVLHTCHSRDRIAFREELGALHMQCLFFRRQSIEDWEVGAEGLASNELNFQIVSQEILGQIEPQVASGTRKGGGSSEAFLPIPERIDHIVRRALSWMRLRRKPERDKKVAVIYWDREMGKAELMRGSATGMHMNAPRSLVKVLGRLKNAGYDVDPLPKDDDELVSWMMERGRQIGIWAPGVLDKLARSGEAVLVPAAKYRAWFESKVPAEQRAQVVRTWGEAPGRFLVWEKAGGKFIVIPRIDLGNIVLLPQPLKGEAHDSSRVHNKLIPPPHNYLATYFWLQEEFGADAFIHFGTHGTEFLLPGKPYGQSRTDWPDMLIGDVPNINPWIINNLGESSPVRRRPYAVLIDHLVPPSVNAELSDELLNLHGDIDKWVSLEEGSLKKGFRASITQQVRAQHLDKDLHLDLSEGELLTPKDVDRLLAWLHEIHNETTPISQHVFGEAPPENLLVPWVVTCLRKRFLDALGEVIAVPAEEALNPGDREKYLRAKAEAIAEQVIHGGATPAQALTETGARLPAGGMPKELRSGFALLNKLVVGFRGATDEIDNLLAALDGRFIPPGPANSPDRNPAVLPTGRNMYLMNPEEIPARPSWELGKTLVDQLLAAQLESRGRYPRRIAFTLNSFATFQDYGVMESQILYLLGVRPVWDARNLVSDLEIIPAEELGRPRIDVFISVLGYYRDMLPTRMRLLDKAIRLISALDEKDNGIHTNTRRVRDELVAMGEDVGKAMKLARGRIFGRRPGEMGNASYYYLVERSGDWDSREDLMKIYLEHSRHVYTEGLWGVDAPKAYERQVQGTEILLRSWSDRTRSPLSNKYDWYKAGSLSLAIKHLTGKEPEWFFSDVRDPERASMVRAEDALRRDYRIRLFNRKWIEGMMREGYAGADQIAVHVKNTMGWKIMRENSVSDDIWEEIVEVFVRDKKNLHIREWFEDKNAFAFQELTEILLETVRKGYWKPDADTLLEIVEAYAESVAEHGEGGGLMGGGNTRLQDFVEEQLRAPGLARLDTLRESYAARSAESAMARKPMPSEAQPVEASADASVEVRGRELAPVSDNQGSDDPLPFPWWNLVAISAAMLLVLAGYASKRGHPGI